MSPGWPSAPRYSTRSSPSSLTRWGFAVTSSEQPTGHQYRRSISPMGVPGPKCVRRSLSSFVSTRAPPALLYLGIAGERGLAAALVLLVGAAGHADGPHDVAALDHRQRAPAGGGATVAGHDQALEPRLAGHAGQLIRGPLEAGGRVGLVRGHVPPAR